MNITIDTKNFKCITVINIGAYSNIYANFWRDKTPEEKSYYHPYSQSREHGTTDMILVSSAKTSLLSETAIRDKVYEYLLVVGYSNPEAADLVMLETFE